MKNVKKLLTLSLLMLNANVAVGMEEKIEITEQKTELPKKFEKFTQLPQEIQYKILYEHLHDLVQKEGSTLDEFNNELGKLKLVSKDVKSIVDSGYFKTSIKPLQVLSERLQDNDQRHGAWQVLQKYSKYKGKTAKDLKQEIDDYIREKHKNGEAIVYWYPPTPNDENEATDRGLTWEELLYERQKQKHPEWGSK